jgi:hypothetical protein
MNRLWLSGLAVLVAAGPCLAAETADASRDALAMAAKIDRYVAAKWREANVQPAPRADDPEFLRRVYLDLAGRIPSVHEARTFLDDKSPDKRAKLIDKLLDSPRYAAHYTNFWRNLLLPETNTNFQVQFAAPQFENWIRKHLAANTPYDVMVRDLITSPVSPNDMNRIYQRQGNDANPFAYYMGKEYAPENLAAAASRVFLGVKIECAQCHNHPFASWKRDQFWQMAAFFAGIRVQRGEGFVQPTGEQNDKREIAIPGTERVVQATFLDGKEPQWKFKKGSRETLAEWMTRPDNPFFARATANRIWGQLMGTGVVDPVDDMATDDNKPSLPEMLDELAADFAAHKFDLKYLIRCVANSQAYQLSSSGDRSQDDPRMFARMPLRGLTPEQLWDSLAEATRYNGGGNPNPNVFFVGGPQGARGEFLSKFGNQNEKASEAQTSILQALTLMNGRVMAEVTHLERSELLLAVVDSPFLDTGAKIETLYLAALSRKPNDRETSRLLRYIDEAKDGEERSRKLSDVFWALLNSSEFILNH